MIIARDPKEGPGLVEVHKQMITLLDEMIEKDAEGVARAGPFGPAMRTRYDRLV
jgi:hypothetical protein